MYRNDPTLSTSGLHAGLFLKKREDKKLLSAANQTTCEIVVNNQ